MKRVSENNKVKDNQARKNIPLYIIIIILLIVIIYSAMQLVAIFSEYHASDSEYNDLSNKYVQEESSVSESDDESDTDLVIDFAALSDINSDVIAWLHFPKIDISYPVVQTDDNDYYISHSFNKEENKAGAIFMDYRNYSSFNDKNTFLYGHNMKNDTMFGLILNYVEEDYYKENPYFWIYTPEAKYKYEIFTSFEETSTGPAYQLNFDNDEEFGEYLNKVSRRKYYETSVNASPSDHVLVLSTCAGEDRFLIFGKRVQE